MNTSGIWGVTGCHRVIGLDGCFLKGQYKGELITAIGRDANNQVHPTSWVVVDIENKKWSWFFEAFRWRSWSACLLYGLLELVKEILPHVEHMQWGCCVHYGGRLLRKNGEYQECDPHAYEHLNSRNPNSWSKVYFETRKACEAVEKGIPKCFNSIILEPKKKPLITMLE
uniref:MULE transposase domain-containing protein n=1 Tax=Lactuca sativa TaxID=4236 RepID=A0A9R1W3D0_LACSA|nr:hypothetical protein LSAT_V11C300124960 [Lactuca sativa]